MQTTRGPLPAAVYWRRRFVVVGSVLALALLAANVVRGGGGSSLPADTAAQMSGRTSGQPTAPSTETDGTEGERRKRNKKDKSAGSSETPNPPEVERPPTPEPEPAEPTGACLDSDVQVTPVVLGAIARRPVTMRLSLQTLSAEACTWRISRAHLALRITDAGGEVWSSRECRRMVPADSVVVRRELTSTFELTWNARLAIPGCPVRQPWAEPGDYELQAAAFGGEPAEPVPFTLTDPDDVVVPSGPLGPEMPGTEDPDEDRDRTEDRDRDRERDQDEPDGAVEPDEPAGR